MTGNEYQRLAARTINQDLYQSQLILHAVFGMCSEAGEIAGLFQKKFQGHKVDFDHLKKEVGDLLWFAAELCTAYDIEMDDVMQLNIDKLKARFPDGFEVEKSLHRKAGDV